MSFMIFTSDTGEIASTMVFSSLQNARKYIYRNPGMLRAFYRGSIRVKSVANKYDCDWK